MSQRNKQAPSNWDTYERGRTSSVGSLTSIAEGEAQNEYQGSPSSPPISRWFRGSEAEADGEQTLRARRSSITMRLNSLRQMGGVNNIDNFARSFQRAAGFREITPVRRGSITYPDDGEAIESDTEERPLPNKSLLRQQFEAARQESPEMAVTDTPSIAERAEPSETSLLLPSQSLTPARSGSGRNLLPDAYPELGTSYGSISSRLTAGAQRRASILIQQHHEASMRARVAADQGEEVKDTLVEPQIEIETRDDGEVIERIVGESTVPMTIFNSINVLIGVGILALPLAVRYSGWVIGMLFLALAAVGTNYTAKLLARCLDTNSGSTTYGDLAFLAYDNWGRALVETLFVIELFAANVALVILFADSMNSIVPAVSVVLWKVVISVGLLPLNFVAFKTLSVTSVLGIGCCIGIVLIVFVDGFIKPRSPGSLRDLAKTYAFPEDIRTIPLSFGLFMAPWGGHSVFPAIYKDMRHPQKYPRALRVTYIFTYGLDLAMAVLGYLMFGDTVRDEVTSNILNSKAYPRTLSVIIVVLIAIIPVTKIPLSNRPIMDTVNKKFYIDLRQMDAKARQYSEKSWKHRLGRGSIAIMCNLIELGIAILLPDFDSVMALMGSALCFTICMILPIAFYLKIFDSNGKQILKKERILGYVLIVICGILGLVGTVFAIIPKDKIGARSCRGIVCMG